MVNAIEKSIHRDEYALGVFLDVTGAFSNLSLEAAQQGMRKAMIKPEVQVWYTHYLRCRTVTADIKGIKMVKRIRKGTPQGGVLSPLVWNLAFD